MRREKEIQGRLEDARRKFQHHKESYSFMVTESSDPETMQQVYDRVRDKLRREVEILEWVVGERD